jgi:hypothetical protein
LSVPSVPLAEVLLCGRESEGGGLGGRQPLAIPGRSLLVWAAPVVVFASPCLAAASSAVPVSLWAVLATRARKRLPRES